MSFLKRSECRSKLHDESSLIQRSFDDNKGDDKKPKSQDHFMITKMMTFKIEFKIELRTLQGSKENWISRIKNQDSRIKLPRIKIKIQDSRFKNQEKT